MDGTTATDDCNGPPNTPLFEQTNLESSGHEITLTNIGRPSNASSGNLDLDFIIWEREIPDLAAPQGVTIGSRNPAFGYSPRGSWSHTPDANTLSGSLAVTQTQAASTSIAFTGSSVALYGSLSSTSGRYSCTVDGVSTYYTPVYGQGAAQQVLCFVDSLDEDSKHMLAVTNIGPGSLSIDHAQFWGVKAFVCRKRYNSLCSTDCLIRFPFNSVAPHRGQDLQCVPASLVPGPHINIISSRSKVIAGAVVGSVVGCLILFLAIIVVLRKSNFLSERLGWRWKTLINAEEKESESLARPCSGNSSNHTSTRLGKALASGPLRRPVGTELLNGYGSHSLTSTDSVLDIAAANTPVYARHARHFGPPLRTDNIACQLPPVYSSPEQSPASLRVPAPARTDSPRNVGGRVRQWV